MNVQVSVVNYLDPKQAQDMLDLLNAYALDPMGGGEPLSQFTRQNLTDSLAILPNAFSVICYVEGKPAGLANCFDGFSTFKCKPLVNIHDIVVNKAFRGLGVSQRLLQKVQDIAVQKGCCKVTLEVLEGNQVAQKAYKKFGFSGYELDPNMGQALFWEKTL